MEKNELLSKDISILIKQIAIPSSLGIFFNTMFNVVDTFYVGSISTMAISALSYSFVLYFLLLSTSIGFSSAITVHVGNSLGRKKQLLAKFFVAKGIGLITYFSIFLVVLGTVFLEELFVLIGAEGEVLLLCLEYTYIILFSALFMLITIGANGVLVALGDTKSYRNSLIFGFFLNLLLDPLFIYGYGVVPAFGFVGVAYATLCVQFITFCYIFYKLSQTELFCFDPVKIFAFNKKFYNKLFKQAFPVSLNMFFTSFGGIILITFISEYGYKAVAAFGIGYRVEQLILLPLLGINTAVVTIIANNYGAKKFERIYEVREKALRFGYMLSGFGIVFLLIFGQYIVMAFDKDIAVVDMAYEYIVIKSFILFAYVTIFISNSTLQGIKKASMIGYVSSYRQVFMPIFILCLAVYIYKIELFYIWILLGFVHYSAAVFLSFYVKRMLKRIS